MAKRIAKKGLWLSTIRVEVQKVSRSMRKPCEQCGAVPGSDEDDENPLRLHTKIGSGRSGSVQVYCDTCGMAWLEERKQEVLRAQNMLSGADVESIRDPDSVWRIAPSKKGD